MDIIAEASCSETHQRPKRNHRMSFSGMTREPQLLSIGVVVSGREGGFIALSGGSAKIIRNGWRMSDTGLLLKACPARPVRAGRGEDMRWGFQVPLFSRWPKCRRKPILAANVSAASHRASAASSPITCDGIAFTELALIGPSALLFRALRELFSSADFSAALVLRLAWRDWPM